MNATPVSRIWIIRRGTGKLEVTPSPAHLPSAPGQFSILNMAQDEAHVVFDQRYVTPADSRIRSGAEQSYSVVGRGPAFFEYDVTFPATAEYAGQKQAGVLYAEGGSKPGAIIDP